MQGEDLVLTTRHRFCLPLWQPRGSVSSQLESLHTGIARLYSAPQAAPRADGPRLHGLDKAGGEQKAGLIVAGITGHVIFSLSWMPCVLLRPCPRLSSRGDLLSRLQVPSLL